MKTITTQMSVRITVENQELQVPSDWTEEQIANHLAELFLQGKLKWDKPSLHEYNCSYVEKKDNGEYDYSDVKGDKNFS